MLKKAALRSLPYWVESPPLDKGSIDPLGYLAPRERIAEKLLPGVTVATLRARYLSFLCWAIKKTGNRPAEIDRWEAALSIGEYRRHLKHDKECSYLGINILNNRKLKNNDPVPRSLHVQTARLLYSGLLISCGLAKSDGQSLLLTDTGGRLAELFGSYNHMPISLPAKVWKCEDLPCLSDIKPKERNLLRRALLEENVEAAQRRLKTFKEIGKQRMRRLRRNGVASLLIRYLVSASNSSDTPATLLRKAALLELQAVPLIRFFLKLYTTEGTFKGHIPTTTGKLRLYEVRDDEKGLLLLQDVGAHLRKARMFKDAIPPLQFEGLKAAVLELHRTAKADNPWVDEEWRILRRGLAPKNLSIHSYRLPAFASLLSDIGVI